MAAAACPPTQPGTAASNPQGAAERAPVPARPWAGVFGRQWLRQQRLEDQEGEKQGGRGRRRGAWGSPLSPLCLPQTPASTVSLSLLPLPSKRRPGPLAPPTQIQGMEYPPIHKIHEVGAGGREHDEGDRPAVSAPPGGDSPCGLGVSGGDLPGAREAPPSSSPSSGSSRARTLGPFGGGIAGLGPALTAHGSRPAPLSGSRSAPGLRRTARAPTLVATASQRDCLRPEPPPAPPAGGALTSGLRAPPPYCPALRAARPPGPPSARLAAPTPRSQIRSCQRVYGIQSLGLLEFQSPRNSVQNFGRGNGNCLQHSKRYELCPECLQKI